MRFLRSQWLQLWRSIRTSNLAYLAWHSDKTQSLDTHLLINISNKQLLKFFEAWLWLGCAVLSCITFSFCKSGVPPWSQSSLNSISDCLLFLHVSDESHFCFLFLKCGLFFERKLLCNVCPKFRCRRFRDMEVLISKVNSLQ